jgi:predicted nucleic acid-binding protein
MLLKSVAAMVRPDPLLFAPIRDVNDIVVVQTAVAGGAEVICTTDRTFLPIRHVSSCGASVFGR